MKSLYLILWLWISSGIMSQVVDTSVDNELYVDESIYEYPCAHDEYFKESNIHFMEDRVNFQKRTEDWHPLVIHAHFLENDDKHCTQAGSQVDIDGPFQCQSAHVVTEEVASHIQNVMVKQTVERLNSILDYDRQYRTSNLTTASSYSSFSLQVPTYLSSGGVDADFILLYTARPIRDSGTLAIATTLSARGAEENYRPIIGYANFDPAKLNLADNDSRLKEIGIAIHEVSHALGFSSSFFNRLDIVGELNGIRTIESPLVRDYVRNHFNCSSLQGALLEDFGGGGTASSHWKKSTYMNEFMTGTASVNPVVTGLTMSFFEDAGWYRANMSRTDPFGWGLGEGCQAGAASSCSHVPNDYKCTSGSVVSKCYPDRTGYGGCGTGTLGISDCPLHQSSVTCMFPFDYDSEEAKAKASSGGIQSGEYFDISSRCFSSTLNKITAVSELFPIPAIKSSKCYPTYCVSPTDLRVRVDEFYYRCDYEGSSIHPTNYGGSIDCSPQLADIICQNALTDDTWPVIEAVDPISASPGASITVIGSGFIVGTEMEVHADFPCTNVTVINSTHITTNLPAASNYGNPKYLNGFGNKITIIVVDEQSRSDSLIDGFQIDMPFGLGYLSALFEWSKKNPLVASLLALLIILPCCCICFCIYRMCRKKKKPKRGEYDEEYEYRDDEYYYEEERVESQRHPPPRSLYYT